MKYRSRTEIISNILRAALDGPCTKTRLMYRAYVSSEQINEYLGYLLSNELLIKEQHMYSLTEKGMQFLRLSKTMSELAPTI
jgi:predicted transcriptional regulator